MLKLFVVVPVVLIDCRSAGPIRNKQMAEYADTLFAFWDGKSRGTKNMIDLAKKKNLHVIIVGY